MHLYDRRSAPRLLRAVAIDEILALKRHSVLNRDTAAECFDAFDVAIRDRLAVVEEPVKTIEWDLAIHLFVYVKRARYRLVVSRVEAEWPAVFDQVMDHCLELFFHHRLHIGAGLKKVLEVCR